MPRMYVHHAGFLVWLLKAKWKIPMHDIVIAVCTLEWISSFTTQLPTQLCIIYI